MIFTFVIKMMAAWVHRTVGYWTRNLAERQHAAVRRAAAGRGQPPADELPNCRCNCLRREV